MRRIVHLSDLHFGRVRPELADPLLDAVAEARPDIVAVSGDLTQRARPAQFIAARAFLDRIAAPLVVVPGNHDAPLVSLIERVLLPWRRWRRWLSTELEPVWRDDALDVIGVNTVDRWSWQRGRFPASAAGRLTSLAGPAPDPARVRIVVAHHPPVMRTDDPKEPTRGGPAGLAALAAAGADVMLTGHLHRWRMEVVDGVVLCAAGSGLSTRLREDENDFNILEVDPHRMIIDRYGAPLGSNAFSRIGGGCFLRGPDGWREVE